MKLLRLKITQKESFRSLPKDFEMHFLRDFDYSKATDFNPYLLAGKNGSGKSNVLEALSEIFYHLDCIYLRNKPAYFEENEEDEIKFNSKFSRVNAYELEYFIFLDKKIFPNLDHQKKAHISIKKTENDFPKIEWVNQSDFRTNEKLSLLESKSLLPEYVIGYASGDNEILSLPFFKSRFIQYDAYLKSLKTKIFEDPSPESSMIYLDESYSQIILLTNLLMWKDENVIEPFRKYVELEDVDTFRIVIRTDIEKEFGGAFSSAFSNGFDKGEKVKLLQNIDNKKSDSIVFIRSYLEKLKRCATTWNEYQNYDTYGEFDDDEEHFDESAYLTLDFKVNKETKKAFQFHFETPLKLFELFQLLIVLDVHSVSEKSKLKTYSTSNIFLNDSISYRPTVDKRIFDIKDFALKKTGKTDTIYTREFSDGEHQFLHSIGLCLLFKDTRSLFLLDEPETHFNPDWKAKFISSLRNSFNKEKKDTEETMREMIITTHSPYLISDSDSKYVFEIKKDEETKKIDNPQHPNFQTFGTSVNKIGIRIFDMPNTIGEYAQKRLQEFYAELELLKTKADMEKLISKVKEEMGDSVERLIFVNKVFDKMK
ncbi:MAG: restriction system-associated AAA family ATPase [Chitinophagales bacterium]